LATRAGEYCEKETRPERRTMTSHTLLPYFSGLCPPFWSLTSFFKFLHFHPSVAGLADTESCTCLMCLHKQEVAASSWEKIR